MNCCSREHKQRKCVIKILSCNYQEKQQQPRLSRHGSHDMGNVWKSMNHGRIMDGNSCAMAEKI